MYVSLLRLVPTRRDTFTHRQNHIQESIAVGIYSLKPSSHLCYLRLAQSCANITLTSLMRHALCIDGGSDIHIDGTKPKVDSVDRIMFILSLV